MKKPIVSWVPMFDDAGNFMELTGWDVVLKHIFLVLVTPKGTRQWNVEFGSRLLSFLFEVDVTETTINEEIQEVFARFLPHVKLISVTTTFEEIPIRGGKKAKIQLKISYDGEDKTVIIKMPEGLDLLRGSIYDVTVERLEQTV
jgi:phage baseplate assembly protein W